LAKKPARYLTKTSTLDIEFAGRSVNDSALGLMRDAPLNYLKYHPKIESLTLSYGEFFFYSSLENRRIFKLEQRDEWFVFEYC